MGIWKGAQYLRKRKRSWRDSNTGVVFSATGTPIGIEPKHSHFYGTDPRKIKKKTHIPRFRGTKIRRG